MTLERIWQPTAAWDIAHNQHRHVKVVMDDVDGELRAILYRALVR
jgi:hypothetical protein